ncbi:MAG: tetratricopeptide repeat protein [Flavobacteriales bacterium]|nr:tetratricopeptide repeat protein [Flavobacteriales bacterium]
MIVVLILLSVQQLLAQDPLQIAKADTLFAYGEWKAAHAIYDRLIAQRDADAHVHHMRGVCKDRLDMDDEEVMADINEALRLDPHLFKALLYRASVYSAMRMFDREIADLTVALEYAPDTAGLVKCFTERGTAHYSRRDFEPSIADLTRALELDSTAHAAYGRLANTLEEVGRGEEALKMQIRYTELVPEDWTGYVNAGFYLANMGRYEEALEWYAKAFERDNASESYHLWNNRGYARYKLGDMKGALKDVRKSISMKPSNAYAYRNLALIHIAEARNDDACTALEKALSQGFTAQYGDEVRDLYRTHCK